MSKPNSIKPPRRTQQKQTPEEIARAIAAKYISSPPPIKATEQMTGGSSSQRTEKARGKQPMQPVEDETTEEEEIAEPIVRNVVKKTKKLPPTPELIKHLMRMSFKGTRYPHHDTMKELGIYRDVEYLLDMCHLGTFMSYQFEAYKEETCHFLATLAVHFYDEDAVNDVDTEDDEGPGLGYITFSVRGEEFSLTIKQLDTLFSFPTGTMVSSDYAEEELRELWLTIAGPSGFVSSRSKGAEIRSPVLRYAHKSIANTLYARKITTTVGRAELELLDCSLIDLLGCTRSGEPLIGDRANTSLTCILLDQLLCYKEQAAKLHRSNRRGELCIGGVVTPILIACDVALTSDPVEPRWIDMPHLEKSGHIDRERMNGQFLYNFHHVEAGCIKKMPLPCPSHTAIRMGSNIDFCPPTMLLYPREQDEASGAEQEEIPQGRPAGDRPYVVDTENEDSPECPLEEFQGRTIQDAHKHISKLRKWSIKAIKALKKTVKELTHTVSIQGNQIRELQGRAKDTPSMPPVKGISILRRSGSTSIAPRRNTSLEPPRASSFEPREQAQHQPRRQWEFQAPSSISQADFYRESDAPAHTTYTRESMEQSIDSFLSQL